VSNEPIAWPADTAAVLSANVTQLVEQAHEAILEEIAAGNWQPCIDVLDAIKPIKDAVAALEHEAKTGAADLLPKEWTELPDGRMVKPSFSARRKNWDYDRLVPKVMEMAGLDPETGELATPTEEQASWAERVVATLLRVVPVTGSTGFRSTALKELRIDDDEYCEKHFVPSLKFEDGAK
jgi:hypothetical protein